MACSQKSQPGRQLQIVIWADLGPKQSAMLKNAEKLNDVKNILAEIFNLCNSSEQHKEKILLNLYTYAVQFAREEQFTVEQLSAHFSIVKLVHEACVESPFGNMEKTFTYFKDLLICHSVCRPPYSTELFSIKDVRKIACYMTNTYFRHFKLYKYVFTSQVRLDLVLSYIGEPDSTTNQETDFDPEKERKNMKSRNSDFVSGDENIEQKELEKIAEKEEAKKHLRKLITEFLQQKINELKLAVAEKLEESEKIVNNKLEDAGYRDYTKKISKRLSKTGKRPSTLCEH
ncbi:coiled-coil domain-containing protein 189-like isoform X2 [Octopus sinensis]|uniref:Coiled-coil domain-containing protein 189-like isoform X2 n=2 Tax=Octopus sinensis TaxID=2607531 RepID=A0A6P7SWG9_9MOLL|nr:coiled-coil domain-containing protein 189-like isoform X2 [Octopus sinensis]